MCNDCDRFNRGGVSCSFLSDEQQSYRARTGMCDDLAIKGKKHWIERNVRGDWQTFP